MDIRSEEVDLLLEAPLEASGLPGAILLGVVFTFLHGDRAGVRKALADLLADLAGEVKGRAGWLQDRLEVRGRLALDAQVRRRTARVQARQRLKAARVAEIAAGLTALGARQVRLQAWVQRFTPPGSTDGAVLDG